MTTSETPTLRDYVQQMREEVKRIGRIRQHLYTVPSLTVLMWLDQLNALLSSSRSEGWSIVAEVEQEMRTHATVAFDAPGPDVVTAPQVIRWADRLHAAQPAQSEPER